MKTVQDYLKTLEKDKLIQTYLQMFPIPYEREASKRQTGDLTVSEIRAHYEAALSDYIDRLRSLETLSEDEEYIFIAEIVPNDYSTEVKYGMLARSELLEKGVESEDYDFCFEGQERIVGRFVADSSLTQKYIYEVVASIIDEMSFFGFNEECIEEERSGFEEALKELEDITRGNDKTVNSSGLLRDGAFAGNVRISVLDTESIDPDQKLRELDEKIRRDRQEYTKYLRGKEIMEILQSIDERVSIDPWESFKRVIGTFPEDFLNERNQPVFPESLVETSKPDDEV